MAKWGEAENKKLYIVFDDELDLRLMAQDVIEAMEYLVEKYKDSGKGEIVVVLDIDKYEEKQRLN